MKRNKKNFNLCTAPRLAHTLTIKEVAKLIGNLVASMEALPYERLFDRQLERDKIKSLQQNKNMEAVSYGKLFYRQLERDKIISLQQNKGNFEEKSDLFKKELTWWENNIMAATKSVKKLPIDTTIYTDASH